LLEIGNNQKKLIKVKEIEKKKENNSKFNQRAKKSKKKLPTQPPPCNCNPLGQLSIQLP